MCVIYEQIFVLWLYRLEHLQRLVIQRGVSWSRASLMNQVCNKSELTFFKTSFQLVGWLRLNLLTFVWCNDRNFIQNFGHFKEDSPEYCKISCAKCIFSKWKVENKDEKIKESEVQRRTSKSKRPQLNGQFVFIDAGTLVYIHCKYFWLRMMLFKEMWLIMINLF